jgi:hypothetical protein
VNTRILTRTAIVGAEESMSTIGTIANIVARKKRKKNVVEAKTKMTMIDLFFVYCGAIIDIGTDISVHMKMIGIVARIGTIQKGLDNPPIQS